MKRISNIIKESKSGQFLVLVFFSLFFSLEYIILGPFSYIRLGDNLDTFLPRLSSMWPLFTGQGINHWYPLLAGGVDRLANEINYLHADSVFFGILPDWLAYVGILLLGTFIGGYYTFLICRDVLKLKIFVSMFAAVAFMYSLVLVDIIPFVFGLAILPFIIYYLELLFSKKLAGGKVRYFLYILALGIIYALFSSLLFILPFTFVAILIWFLLIRKKKLISVGILFIFFIPSLVFNVQEIWSLLINAPLSIRSGGYFDASFPHYISLVQYLISLYWILLLIILAGFVFKIRDRLFYSFSVIIFLCLFVAPLYPWFSTVFGDSLPFFKDFDFSRFHLLAPFFSALTVAIVFDKIKGTVKFSENSVYSLSGVVLIFVMVVLIFSDFSLKMTRSMIWLKHGGYVSHTDSVDSLEFDSSNKNPFRLATIVGGETTLVPTSVHLNGFETVDGHVNLVSQRYLNFFRVMSKDNTIKSSLYFFNQPTDEDIESFVEDSSKYINSALLSLSNVRYVISTLPVYLPSFKLVEDISSLDNSKWDSFTYAEKLKLRLKENFSGKKTLIYENSDVFGRFFLAKDVEVFSTSESLLTALNDATTSTLRQTAFVELDDVEKLDLPVFSGSFENIIIKKYSPDEIILDVASDGPSILVISNNYSPFWKIRINGEITQVVPVYHTFMGVVLENDENEVVISYEPDYALSKIFTNY